MRIAILGSGRMGGALGRRFAAAGHDVIFSYSHSREKLEKLARKVGKRARAGEPREAVAAARVVLLSIPWGELRPVLRAAGSLRGKVVIDCTNPMAPSDEELAVGLHTSGAEVVARRARGARVVKAFNTVPSELLRAGPRSMPSRPMVCYCGNHDGAKRTVARLIREIGYEPVNCGALSVARYLEPFALLVAQLAYGPGKRPEVGIRFMRPTRRSSP